MLTQHQVPTTSPRYEPPSGPITRSEQPAARGDSAIAAAEPDAAIAPAGESVEASAWQRDKRITALWSSTGSHAPYVFVTGLGWKKLAAHSASAALALTTLAAQGQLARSRVDYREDAEGNIAEMYVW